MKQAITNTRTLIVVDYDPSWPANFNSERSLITKMLGNNAIAIHHIGSTSVEGLAAKPIIDILLEVSCLNELDNQSQQLAEIGYVAKGENGITGRRYFQKGGTQRSHQIHAFQAQHPAIVRHLAFRDYLMGHPDIANEYGKLKRALVPKCQNCMQTYMAGKNEFIQHHERLALDWHRQSSQEL